MGRISSRAARVDKTQKEIASELRAGGALVHVILDPVDLQVGVFGRWILVDCKTVHDDGFIVIPKKQRSALEEIQAHELPFVFLIGRADAKKMASSERSLNEMCKVGSRQLEELVRVLLEKDPSRDSDVWVKVRMVNGCMRFG